MFEFDLADKVDDLICTFEGNPDSDMDTISILVSGWIIFVFLTILSVKYLYQKYKKPKEVDQPKSTSAKFLTPDFQPSNIRNGFDKPKQNGTDASESLVRNRKTQQLDQEKVRKVLNEIKVSPQPQVKQHVENEEIQLEKVQSTINFSNIELIKCSGPDGALVNYVNKLHSWFQETKVKEPRLGFHLNIMFLEALNKVINEISLKEANETRFEGVELTEFSIHNLFAELDDARSNPTIKVTCDLETNLKGHFSYGAPVPDDSSLQRKHYEFMVNRLVGRLKLLVDIKEENILIKFDGWPEICLTILNSKEPRLDPTTSEAVAYKLTTAIRNFEVELKLKEIDVNYPKLDLSTVKIPKRKLSAKAKIKPYLKITVVKGVEIAVQKDYGSAYCVVELDEPPQKYQTESKSLPNPSWDEPFLFETGNNADGEILFEAHGSTHGTPFLGCSIVSVDQVIDGTPQVIQLKSRRMKSVETITGSLEVLFTFLEKAEAMEQMQMQGNPAEGKFVLKGVLIGSGSGNTVITTKTQSLTPTAPVRKRRDRPKDTSNTALENQYGEERGRRRTRKGNIFTSLRRRFSQERSKSVIPGEQDNISDESLLGVGPGSMDFRSQSADRPGGRVFLGLGDNSNRSSASELSQFSTQSTSTFTHESSTIIIECIEGNMKRYYLVPIEALHTGKWKNGKKLHIYNDHTFVAKRIQSGLCCTVCFGIFPFSLRKQGYKCRDCRLICHKECHIRVENYCEKTTIYDIDVIPVHKPSPKVRHN